MFRVSNMLLFFLLFVFSSYSNAGLQINKTRVIMLDSQESTAVKISNKKDIVYGVQTWIDKISGKEELMTFPSLFTVSKSQPQSLKIIRTEQLNRNMKKEELYWLNVQEIPPKQNDLSSSKIQLAVRTKIKIIVRPNNLSESRTNAESNLNIKKVDRHLLIENPTPYFFFAYKIVDVNGKEQIENKLNIIYPEKSFKIDNNLHIRKGDCLEVYYINDYGAENKVKIKVE
ncbi:fimbrial biogenesis chaperone [Photobacterium damselae]|uniref:fimbrial biogenesis chaperone n=1 Tax=Photobacterium damselae TaxID=38293 RepID=UPI00370CEEB4